MPLYTEKIGGRIGDFHLYREGDYSIGEERDLKPH